MCLENQSKGAMTGVTGSEVRDERRKAAGDFSHLHDHHATEE